MRAFSELMGRVARVAATILLTDICNNRIGVFRLDLKRSAERIFRAHGDVVYLSFKFKSDGKLHCVPPLLSLVGHCPMRNVGSIQRFGETNLSQSGPECEPAHSSCLIAAANFPQLANSL
jgi:hypothetical protein